MQFKLPQGVTQVVGKACQSLKKASPEIALGVGLVGIGVSTYVACKQSTKLNDVLTPHKDRMADIKARAAEDKTYAEKQAKKDTAKLYLDCAWALTKLYGPALMAEITSIGLVVLSHHQLRVRNAQLTATLSSVTTAFRDYRKRVRDELGEEADQRFRYGLETQTIKDENGEESTVQVATAHPDPLLFYFDRRYTDAANEKRARKADGTPQCFEDGRMMMVNDIEHNLGFLNRQQAMWNDFLKLNRSKKVYLNEILKELGFETVDCGQDLGWFYDPDDANKDNFIDFGAKIVTLMDDDGRPYTTILLDFNCDGNIRDIALRKKKRGVVKARRRSLSRA